MARHAHNRLRSFALGVDPLEGRTLLSRAGVSIEVPVRPHAQIAPEDGDDGGQTPAIHAQAAHGPALIANVAEKDDAPRGPAVRERTEIEPIEESRTATTNPGDEDSVGLLAPEDMPPLDANSDSLNGAPDDEASSGAGGQREPFSNLPLAGIAQTFSGTVDPLTPASQAEGGPIGGEPQVAVHPAIDSRAEIPAIHAPAEARADEDTESPQSEGLLSQALPFTGELLARAVDEALDHFEDWGILDSVGSIVNPGALGVAAIVLLGAVEVSRRLHPKDCERESRRSLSKAMVPGLRSARAT